MEAVEEGTDDRVRMWAPVGQAVALLLGPYAEVVLHDPDTDRILAIWNPMSFRGPGDPSMPADGRRLSSVSAVQREPDGKAAAVLCVNLDRTPLEQASAVLTAFGDPTVLQPEPLFDQDRAETGADIMALATDRPDRTQPRPIRQPGDPPSPLSAYEERHRRFSVALAHELRTPVAALGLQLEEALAHAEGDETRSALHGALRAAERLGMLVNDLLFLEQVDAARNSARQPVDLTSLIIQQNSQGSRHQTRLDLAQSLTVPGIPALLARLVTNLLDNAERHASSAVTVTLRHRDHQAVITVTDDGPGIPSPHRDRVFDLFYRPDTARSRQAGGAGLGLTIARAIAGVHHGTLTTAATDDGAQLTCRLPAQ
ncbi:hypothetical protein D0T12_19515 [Actinomadura spongiicola]|uniref:histidine kinase n=1 Tax=Actinomadura spongiicola TaxID=2303421 RepID=A0A372GGT3_9ACTN|nr:ATP-binding protein [Actinomadura spongiicola]RFS84309.1 hypothetical protein D0T12_19515 [Actinomadura spongiicola]